MTVARRRLSVLIPRWIARVLGLLLLLLVVTIAVGEVIGSTTYQPLTARETLMMCAFVVSLSGLVVGWWREGIGGTFVLGGLACFFLVHYLHTGRIITGWVFIVLAIPGVLFLGAAWQSRAVERPAAG